MSAKRKQVFDLPAREERNVERALEFDVRPRDPAVVYHVKHKRAVENPEHNVTRLASIPSSIEFKTAHLKILAKCIYNLECEKKALEIVAAEGKTKKIAQLKANDLKIYLRKTRKIQDLETKQDRSNEDAKARQEENEQNRAQQQRDADALLDSEQDDDGDDGDEALFNWINQLPQPPARPLTDPVAAPMAPTAGTAPVAQAMPGPAANAPVPVLATAMNSDADLIRRFEALNTVNSRSEEARKKVVITRP